MATITIDIIPSQHIATVQDAFANTYGYRANITDPITNITVPNAETKAQFAKRKVAEYVKGIVAQDKANRDAAAAIAAAKVITDGINIT